jgi:hypothetical protein
MALYQFYYLHSPNSTFLPHLLFSPLLSSILLLGRFLSAFLSNSQQRHRAVQDPLQGWGRPGPESQSKYSCNNFLGSWEIKELHSVSGAERAQIRACIGVLQLRWHHLIFHRDQYCQCIAIDNHVSISSVADAGTGVCMLMLVLVYVAVSAIVLDLQWRWYWYRWRYRYRYRWRYCYCDCISAEIGAGINIDIGACIGISVGVVSVLVLCLTSI